MGGVKEQARLVRKGDPLGIVQPTKICSKIMNKKVCGFRPYLAESNYISSPSLITGELIIKLSSI